MLNTCSRCGRRVKKLVPIDDAYRSAQEPAEWSGLLEVPYISTYTEYVCITCAKQILEITDEDLIRKKEYNQVRPHSARNYRPPAPETILTMVTT